MCGCESRGRSERPQSALGCEITDIEDTDTAEAVRADGRVNALRSTIDASASLLHGHEEQISIDRNISLSSRTNHGCDRMGLCRVLNGVGGKPVEVAHEQVVARERDVGVCEIQSGRTGRRDGRRIGWLCRRGLRVICVFRFCGSFRRCGSS